MRNPKDRIQKPDQRSRDRFHIYGEKNGRREHYKTVKGKKEAREEVDRLNEVNDSINYKWVRE